MGASVLNITQILAHLSFLQLIYIFHILANPFTLAPDKETFADKNNLMPSFETHLKFSISIPSESEAPMTKVSRNQTLRSSAVWKCGWLRAAILVPL